MFYNEQSMTREERQQEAIDSYFDKGLIKAAPRFGKIKVAIGIMNKVLPGRILICYPRNDIREGWVNDFNKWGFTQNVEFQTFTSIEKELDKEWDFVVIDEIHEASTNQLDKLGRLKSKNTLALSGTCTNKTLKSIFAHTDITTCYDYPIAKAVEEGVLCDYTITIHTVPLEKDIKSKFSKLEYVKKKLTDQKKPTFFLDLKQINLIQNSSSKALFTKQLINKFKEDRLLIFCGVTAIADSLGVPVYHSKKKEEDVFIDFCTGGGKHMVTIKMAQSGITVLPINKGILNYTSGNPEDTAQKICRFLGFEYNTPDKKADIHLVVSDEKFEMDRVETALMFFDKNKIKLGW